MSKFKINPKINMNKSPAINSVGIDPIGVASPLPSVEVYEKFLREQMEENYFQNLSGLSGHYAITAFASIYSRVSNKLQEVMASVDSIRKFYLTDVMLSQIAEDALAPRMGSDEIIRFSADDQDIQKELDELHKRIGLDQLIENVTPDLLAYGEYTLATKIDTISEKEDELNDVPKKGRRRFKAKRAGKGIVDVTDIVEQGKVISLTQDGKTEGYLQINELTGRMEVKEIADFIKFQLGGERVKIDLDDVIPKSAIRNKELRDLVDKIPRFIRVGKSVLYPVLSKIKELELLEKLVPATKLNKLSQGNLVGMALPENYDLEQALNAVRRVEGMINKKVSVDPALKEITVEAILSTAGKTRVIPLMGDKGSLQQLDYKSDEPDDLLNSANEIRKLILDSVGIPSELVFSSDGDSKTEVLKRYAKYLRKLKKVQKAIASGCKQIAFIHLANRGIKFKEESIDVVFNNNLVEIDNLDKLEHADVTTSLLSNVRDFFNDMVEEDSPYREMVNLEKVAEYMEENLKTVGLADAIKLPKEGGVEPDKEAVDVDGIDSDGNQTRPENEPDEE
jgi:hypothetical protein